MILYFDSGVLFKLYVPEPESPRVLALVREAGVILFTPLHHLEIRNAVHAKSHRREITAAQATSSLRLLAADLASGRLHCPPLPWSEIYEQAGKLADRHTATIGCRTLDVLHVAMAITLGCAELQFGKYPVVTGRDCLTDVRHGCGHPPSPKPTGLEILKISAATRGEFIPTERKSFWDTPRFRQEFELRKGDVLMCRTNGTLAYVGMSALVEEDQHHNASRWSENPCL